MSTLHARPPETIVTGALVAALLDPAPGTAVLSALAPNLTGATVTGVAACTKVLDIAVTASLNGKPHNLLVEVKQAGSKSHPPGWKTNAEAAWQTDQAVTAMGAGTPPAWAPIVDVAAPTTYVLLDARGRTMDKAFERTPFRGQHNGVWTVVSWSAAAAALTAVHLPGLRGLITLLSA